MTVLPLLPNDPKKRGAYLGRRSLPANYMSDFSIMGFVVDPYEEACSLLRTIGYQLVEHDGGSEISVDSRQSLLEIRILLEGSGIHCEYGDIADTIYQA